jgi:hypothetical protein
MRRFLILTTGLLLGGLLFAESTQAQCGLFGGAGLFGRRARAESYSAGYGAACYGQSYVGATYATAGPRPFAPIRNLLGGRRVALMAQPYAPAGYAGSTPGRFVWTPANGGSWLWVAEDSGYVHGGTPTYPPTNCPGGTCPNPSPQQQQVAPQQPQAPAVPPKVTPTPQAPSVPPPAPHVSDPHHSRGNGCQCGDAKCTHGIGVCPCRNPRCICEHEGGRRFPR